jgi:hypothetical protein
MRWLNAVSGAAIGKCRAPEADDAVTTGSLASAFQ